MKIKSLLFVVSALYTSLSQGAIVFTESFTYANGPLISAAGSPWTTTSGATPGQVDVASNVVNLTGVTETEDVAANFSSASTFGTVAATMDVLFTALPTTTGNYFTHFKDSTLSGFRARVTSFTTGAGAGLFRLGISNDGGATVPVPTDLALNTTYAITFTWDFATSQSSLSIGGGTAVTDTDAATNLTFTSIGLRQSTNMGTLTVDNISVDAIPEPTTTLLGALGFLAILRRRR